MKDDSTIIKPEYKGRGLFTRDKEDYLRECLKQLLNEKIYKRK